MGSFYDIGCSNCDFRMGMEGYDQFYIDHNSGELVEYMLLMMTRIDSENELSGYIERTYCPDCDKIVKTYIITESKYLVEESINKLKELLKISDINETRNIDLLISFYEGEEGEISKNKFLDKFRKNENILTVALFEERKSMCDFETNEEFYEHLEQIRNYKINCPKCGKQLYRNFHAAKCPKCGNKIIFGDMVMLD